MGLYSAQVSAGRRSWPPARIEGVEVTKLTLPTAAPESDGTFAWDATTLVVVELYAEGERGLGYSYTARAAGDLIEELLAPEVLGKDAMAVGAVWEQMQQAVRNVGRPGIAATAISALDVALWDLKARLLGTPLVVLLGAVRPSIAVYFSGGFTSYRLDQLTSELRGAADAGMRAVKMKVGRHPSDDVLRVAAARRAIGERVELFVDANGAYDRKQALELSSHFAEQSVSYFEEPVSSDDLEGLRLLRDSVPAGLRIAAGEYGYVLDDFRRLLEQGAVDVLQADATRCLGISGFLRVSALCEAFHVPLSSHTAPALHAHLGCACLPVVHCEWFVDHARIEERVFEGATQPADGCLRPDLERPGLGLGFDRKRAALELERS